MKYHSLATARRKIEIYPEYVCWLAYDSKNNLLGYLDKDGNEVKLDEDEEVTPEKLLDNLKNIIEENKVLKEKLSKNVNVDGKNKEYMLSFSIRGDDPEVIYGLKSKEEANKLLERNKLKYGNVELVSLKEYYISWKN